MVMGSSIRCFRETKEMANLLFDIVEEAELCFINFESAFGREMSENPHFFKLQINFSVSQQRQ